MQAPMRDQCPVDNSSGTTHHPHHQQDGGEHCQVDATAVSFNQDNIDIQIPIEFRTISVQISEGYQHSHHRAHSLASLDSLDSDADSSNSNHSRSGRSRSRWRSWPYWFSRFFMFGKPKRNSRRTRAIIQQEFARLDHHRIDLTELYARYATSPDHGLSSEAVVALQARDGFNRMTQTPSHLVSRILNYIFGGLSALVWFSVLMAFIAWRPLGHPPDTINLALAIVLLLVILIQTIFNMWQEWTTFKVMNSLSQILPSECVVIRNDLAQCILAEHLVVGDVVKLKAGDQVPADLRLIDVSRDLSFDRSVLTGESEMVYGTINATTSNYLETRNIALMGTHVATGNAVGVVVSTGDRVVMRRIAEISMADADEKTLLQREINRFVAMLATLALSLAAMSIIIWAAWLRPTYPGFLSPSAAMVNIIAILVGVLPSGVPICVALTLNMMAKRMQSQMVLVKNLNTVEALGSVNVICCDKTGTITKSDMFVQDVAFIDRSLSHDEAVARLATSEEGSDHRGGARAMSQLYQVMTLCNNANFDPSTLGLPIPERKVNGDATDSAILRFAALLREEAAGQVAHLDNKYTKIYEIPFNSKNKWMMTIHRDSTNFDEVVMMVKGAPDVMLPRCREIMTESGDTLPFDEAAAAKLKQIEDDWSKQGKRVLMFCCKQLDAAVFNKEVGIDSARMEALANYHNNGLTVLGLVSIIVPPRPEIPEVVDKCHQAGIRVMMVTGDYGYTATAIARQCHIITCDQTDVLEDVFRLAESESESKPEKNFVDSPATVENSMSDGLAGDAKEGEVDGKTPSKPQMLRKVDSNQTIPVPYESQIDPAMTANLGDAAERGTAGPTDDVFVNLPPNIIRRALVLTGNDISYLSKAHWDLISRYKEVVFSRTTPEQKLCIINEFREREYIVAALGDGINDAPALKAAHVGVAMGGGAEAAKEAAGMVLLDNNFSSLLVGIENGRLAFDNLKKVILYLIPAGSFSELLPIIINIFLGVPLPLSAFFMIVICVLTDVASSIALISEKPEMDILARPPRDAKRDRLVNFRFISHCYFFLGMIEFLCAHSMYFFYMYHYHGIPMSKLLLAFDKWQDGFMGYSKEQLDECWYTAQSVYFVTLVVCQFGNLLTTRTRRVSIIRHNPVYGPARNLRIFIGMLTSLAIAIIVVYVPPLNDLFHTRPVPAMFWFIPLAFAFAIVVLDELRKLAVRRWPRSIIAKAAW